VSSDVADNWDRRHGERERFARLEKRLDAIDDKLKEIHDERERAKGVRKFLAQIAAVAAGLLGGGWTIIQIIRVFIHGL
jgi:hypothetical protein